jgi:hypothetical protein
MFKVGCSQGVRATRVVIQPLRSPSRATLERLENQKKEMLLVRLGQSVGKRAAVQTLRDILPRWSGAERLDCGGFSTAFAATATGTPKSATGAAYHSRVLNSELRKTSNTQHRTSKGRRQHGRWMLDVRCWMFPQGLRGTGRSSNHSAPKLSDIENVGKPEKALKLSEAARGAPVRVAASVTANLLGALAR